MAHTSVCVSGNTYYAIALLLMCCIAHSVDARPSPLFSILEPSISQNTGARKLSTLVNNALVLPYHNGPLLSGNSNLDVYVIWYGIFSPAQQSIVRDLLASFRQSSTIHPSVSSWWALTAGYKDTSNAGVRAAVQLGGEVSDAAYSLGKNLKTADIESLVSKSLATLPSDSQAIYLVLTAEDVFVEGFCMDTCASHSFIAPSAATKEQQLPFAWVGNSATQCPGQCAWPYALPHYGPQGAKALIAPNGDVGVDGMVINIGSMLAGTATDPFNNGYYQGSAAAPLEAATACTGIYGKGAYPGNPGDLLQDNLTGASYNALGVNSRQFLLPALWDPSTSVCTPPS